VLKTQPELKNKHLTLKILTPPSSQQVIQIQRFGVHYQRASRVGGPGFAGPVPVQFDAVAVGVVEVQGFGYAVVGAAGERIMLVEQALQYPTEVGAGGVEDGGVKQARRAFALRGPPAPAVPEPSNPPTLPAPPSKPT